ncbi:pentatricopeptide repeat-containing protein At2g35030, mitochondrial-like [Rosa chinensis]|uniref:pentatricopeptide repeat-containing protein At2g35030, mitochondrial-like n=1 Tax=Rosa chinensis TaxID=74649 RepID=UPI001AD8D656|nr:pentatricopeptide repeat-containing protein At2g35030, mitochondrial-like [Rosa chinensis]
MASSNKRFGLWQMRANRDKRDPHWDMFLSWFWIWLRLSTACRICLHIGKVERRGGVDGACRQQEWFFVLVDYCLISPYSSELGLVSYSVEIGVGLGVLPCSYAQSSLGNGRLMVRVWALWPDGLCLISPYSSELGLVSYSVEIGVGLGVLPCSYAQSSLGNGRLMVRVWALWPDGLWYVHNNEVERAYGLFVRMPERDLFSWTLMITCCTRNGELERARGLFNLLPDKRDAAWYTKNREMCFGLRFFAEMLARNVVLWNLMLDGFVQIAQAGDLFEQTPSRNVVAWNAMLAGYVQDHQIDKAVKIFRDMPETDSVSWTTMINGYVRVGKLDEARELLNWMPYKNIAAQTAMISGCAHNGRMDEASQIFNQIAIRDGVCWNTMKNANKDSWNTMITGYAQVGEMDKALQIFEEMGDKNIVPWNSLITGYVQNGLYLDALKSIVILGQERKRPDQSTFSCGLSAYANLADLQVGRQLHHLVVKTGYLNDLFVSSALITMYAKCGTVVSAKLAFKDINHGDIIPRYLGML